MIYSQDLFSFSIKCYPKIEKLPKNQEAFAERAKDSGKAIPMGELAVEFNPYGGLVPKGLVSANGLNNIVFFKPMIAI